MYMYITNCNVYNQYVICYVMAVHYVSMSWTLGQLALWSLECSELSLELKSCRSQLHLTLNYSHLVC